MEWISVEERLPEFYQYVLVCDVSGYMKICYLTEFNIWHPSGWFLRDSKAWMPLPEPPK